MGLFSRRKDDPGKAVADALASRGVRVRGEVLAVSPEGDGHAVSVRFAPEGSREHRRVVVHQRLTARTLGGIQPGHPVELSYDAENPTIAMIVEGEADR